MHIEAINIDPKEVANAKPLAITPSARTVMWTLFIIGFTVFTFGFIWAPHNILWGSFYSALVFWTGIAVGGVMISVIFQVVKAQWSIPIRRIAEANVGFLPWAYLLILTTYFGKEHLFTWARTPMRGREFWMEPNFVYIRFTILLGILFYMMWRFVRMSVAGDIQIARSLSKPSSWGSFLHRWIAGEQGTTTNLCDLQCKVSWNAPLLVALYAVIYSLFSFEMIMGMNPIWYSNMFGGYMFIGNIYCGWAMLSLLTMYFASRDSRFRATVTGQQYHDLGKLVLGFSILWAYLFFSQFLPMWYGNLPEETQWMILRTREYPWKSLAWIVFPMCFIIPFILLLSKDIKKTPFAFTGVCLIVLVGMALERYILIMPEINPASIPLGVYDLALFVGFLGLYLLSVDSFLSRVPSAPLAYHEVYGEKEGH